MIVHRTVLIIETFCDEPAARNSKRWPPYGKGEVRLRSSAGTLILPPYGRSIVAFAGVYVWPVLPSLNSLRKVVSCSPR